MSQPSALSDGERKKYKKRLPENATPSSDPKSLMDTVMLARHLGRQSKMAITRLRKHADPEVRLPEPDLYLGPIPHWYRKTIDDYLERQVARSKSVMQRRLEHADKAIAGRQAKRAETAVKTAAHASGSSGVGSPTPQPSSAPPAALRGARLARDHSGTRDSAQAASVSSSETAGANRG